MAEPFDPDRPTRFLVVGAMKSGTTTFTSLLEDHPDVELAVEKETSAFLSPDSAAAATRAFEAASARAVGEVSTGYMQAPIHEPRPDLVLEHLGPEVQIIAVLRDPYERAVSHWRHWHQLGRASAPMEDALLDADGAYRAFSSYHRQLQPWIAAFGHDRVHPFRLEDYSADPGAVTRELWSILSVPARPGSDEVARQQNSGDTRVVARGFARRISRSPAYRRVVRPLLPTRARRLGASGLGGARGRVQAEVVTDTTRAAFLDLVAEDLAALADAYPNVQWDGVQGGATER